jgi:lipoprotein-releasing system permease protein
VQEEVQKIMGNGFVVKTKYQQHELLYKIMKSEKWAVFLILSFILIIATFNVVSSLTMLIIEKKKDIGILKTMGAHDGLIGKIFLTEGLFITNIGAVSGLLIGALICYAQKTFGIIKLHGDGAFVIDAYPVEMMFTDFIYVFITVLMIGFVAAWLPVRQMQKAKEM